MTNRLLLLLVFLFTILGLEAQNKGQIRICWPDGQYSIMSFDATCRMLYGETAVNIITDYENVEFSYDEILKIDIVTQKSSGISDIDITDSKIHLSQGIVTISELTSGTQCTIYNLQGVKLSCMTAQEDGSTMTINLNQFDDNTLILLVGNHSYKLKK
ncbi:MAG: hypothetical protein K2H33_03940 [Muribaculaceae bacterium]|nr:hypothetical protein [Muribaculaceae bacterium]